VLKKRKQQQFIAPDLLGRLPKDASLPIGLEDAGCLHDVAVAMQALGRVRYVLRLGPLVVLRLDADEDLSVSAPEGERYVECRLVTRVLGAPSPR